MIGKKSENVFLSPTDSYFVGFQQKRGFELVELRPLYQYESDIHKFLKALNQLLLVQELKSCDSLCSLFVNFFGKLLNIKEGKAIN